MTITLDGYTFPEGDKPYHGPLEERDEQRWREDTTLGESSIGTILTFEGLRSQKIPMESKATTATKDKLLEIYENQEEVLLITDQDTDGFTVLLTDLTIEYNTPIAASKYLCKFSLRSRREKTGTPTDLGESPDPIEEEDLPTIVRKTADETVNNSTTLQNDNELFFAAGANEVWVGRILLILRIKSASGFKFHLSAPAGATGEVVSSGPPEITLSEQQIGASEALSNELHGKTPVDSVGRAMIITFVVKMGSTAGNIQVQWAQLAAVAENTDVEANSHIIAWKQ